MCVCVKAAEEIRFFLNIYIYRFLTLFLTFLYIAKEEQVYRSVSINPDLQAVIIPARA